MAATGTGGRVSTIGGGCDLGFDMSVKSIDVDYGRTTLEWIATLIPSQNYLDLEVPDCTWTLTIDGQEFSGTNTLIFGARTRIIASGEVTVQHAPDGTFYNVYWEFTQTNEAKTVAKKSVISNYLSLDPVPPWRFISTPNFNDEENPTVTYTLGDIGITEAYLALSFNNGANDHIPYRAIETNSTSYTFNFTEAEREILRENTIDSNTRSINYVLKVIYNGKEYYRQSTRTLRIINNYPELIGEVKDVNAATIALTGDDSVMVKYCSDIEASLTAYTKKHAILDTYYIKNGTTKQYSSYYTFNSAENNAFEFYVKDSRFNVVTKTITMTMVDYIKPTVNIANNKPDTNGHVNVEVSGNCFNGSFGAVNNSLSVEFRYKPGNGGYSSWTEMAVSTSDNTYTATAEVYGLDYRETYVFEARATDKLSSVFTDLEDVQSIPVFSWSKDDFRFETDVEMTKNLRLKGDGNYGNTIYFGDGGYASISEPTDDDLIIKATDLTLNAANININGSNLVSVNNVPLPVVSAGTWEPMLAESGAVSSYEVRQGWYYRVGNTCTLGWQIKANCNSGYTTTVIKIANAPYLPEYTAAGGGIAHNVIVSGTVSDTESYCFEGWVIDSDGGITARLQKDSGKYGGALEISSNVRYPADKLMTLMGSITYQIKE